LFIKSSGIGMSEPRASLHVNKGEVRGHYMCKGMPVIPVNRGVDKKILI
jgi:hypothetical protein